MRNEGRVGQIDDCRLMIFDFLVKWANRFKRGNRVNWCLIRRILHVNPEPVGIATRAKGLPSEEPGTGIEHREPGTNGQCNPEPGPKASLWENPEQA